MKSQDPLEVTTSVVDDVLVVHVRGDIDLGSSPQLREQVIASFEDKSADCLALDIRDTAFIDSAGLALIVQLRKHYAPERALGLIIQPGSQPERVLRLGRFETFLPVRYSVEEIRSVAPTIFAETAP